MLGYKKIILITSSLACLIMPTIGQNTNSPYSRYGYGVLSDQAIGANKAMGGIRYGVRGLNTNPGNPASYSAVDSLTYIFDVGISYTQSSFKEGNNKQNDHNGGLDHVTMQFPVAKKFGMSIGLLPFSSVGYDFGSIENTDITTNRSFSGSGGFNQVYLGLAYEPISNLSIGTNISYLFGNTKYNRNLTIPSVASANAEYWYNQLTMNALKLDFGVQYSRSLNENNDIVIGAVFSPRVKKSGKIQRYHNIISSAGTVIEGDTTTHTGNQAHADIANTFCLGFTLTHKKNLTIGADITYQDWSNSRYSKYMEDDLDNSDRFNDRWRFNTGVEYAINPRDRSFVKRMKFRGGFNYSNSYINVMNSDSKIGGFKEYGVTLGFGLPIKDASYSGRTSYININFEYTTLKPNISNMISENYFGVSLNVNINELWFLKNRFR